MWGDDERCGTQGKVLSHAMNTCAGGFQAWLWTDKMGTAQTHGAPTTTAVGWYNNKLLSDVRGQ